MAFDTSLFLMSIDDIYNDVLSVPVDRKRLPVFIDMCNSNSLTSVDGFSTLNVAKYGSSYPDGVRPLQPNLSELWKRAIPFYHDNDVSSSRVSYREPHTSFNEEKSSRRSAIESRQYVDNINLINSRPFMRKRENDNSKTEPFNPQNVWKTAVSQQGCTFCRTNGERSEVYESHCVKNSMNKVTCPVLRDLICSECGATGDDAHTITYCPRILMKNNGKIVPTSLALKKSKIKSNGKRRY